MGELLPYYALFYVLGLLLMALFIRLYFDISIYIRINYRKIKHPCLL